LKISLNWLKEYVDLKGISSEQVINMLTMAGLEVEDFVDFLVHREADERGLTHAAGQLATTAFTRVWDNPADTDYDRL